MGGGRKEYHVQGRLGRGWGTDTPGRGRNKYQSPEL